MEVQGVDDLKEKKFQTCQTAGKGFCCFFRNITVDSGGRVIEREYGLPCEGDS